MGGRDIYFFFRNELYIVFKFFLYCLEVILINKILKFRIIFLRFFLIKSLIYLLGICMF